MQTTESSWVREFPNKRFETYLHSQAFTAHQREFHIIAFLKQGKIQLHHRERANWLNAGDCVFIPAGEIHAFSSVTQVPSLVRFHYIDTLDFIHAAQGCVAPKISHIANTKNVVFEHTDFLFKELEIPIPKSAYAHWLAYLTSSLCRYFGQRLIVSDRDLTRLTGAKTHIQNNLGCPFSLEEVASQFCFDKYELSRKFKQVFGVSLFQHIHASRIVLGKALLGSGVTIAEVALELGYSDQSHFTRFFKRFVGISPSIWVQLARSAPLTPPLPTKMPA
ncbi:AraC family transcriptional regulator [Alteromonas sediminis]|uniref:AraC family transcriptional regulator n=1 Tax=Alteromonas sediminis TaxID=2259342 RepID=A0A3N5XY53_9ALTE|nr:AraC family transcriptional regulator [Alteromonas sediminis]RPJ65832.1 AraC family transcriptional regulator [Alteromonas sediminis]